MSVVSISPTVLSATRWTRREAQARTTLAQRASGMPFEMGVRWLADLRPVMVESRGDFSAPTWSIRWEWAGAHFMLQLPAAAAVQCVDALLGDGAVAQLPAELARVSIESALAGVLAQLQALGRGAPQLIAVQDSADVTAPETALLLPHRFSLMLTAESGTQAIDASVYTDSLGLMLLAGLVTRRRVRDEAFGADAVALRLAAEIGFTQLPMTEVGALAPGDVVLFDTFHSRTGRQLWLTVNGTAGLLVAVTPHASGAAAAAAPEINAEVNDGADVRDASGAADAQPTYPSHAAPSAITVLQPWTSPMPADTPASDATPLATLDAVPVRLSFDLGEISMTLAQVRALQPGQPLELGRPLEGPVRIRANGALIGDGELVEIDGQLGVSIRALFAPAAAAHD